MLSYRDSRFRCATNPRPAPRAFPLRDRWLCCRMTQTAGQIRAASLFRALAGLGDWWSALIVREAFTGTRRFADFQAHLGIARQTLSLRLRELVDNGILYAKPYQQGPLRHEYRLTIKGLDLYGYALMCWKWSRKWGDEADSRL